MPVDWRKSPKSVSLADIEKTSDDELWQIIFLALVPRVSGTMDEQYEIVKSWSAGLQMLWATQLVEDEVNNGGSTSISLTALDNGLRRRLMAFD